MKDKAKKYTLRYTIAVLLIAVITHLPAFKSGPCTPNFDILAGLAGFVLGLMSFIWLILSIITYFKQKAGKRIIAIHGCAFVLLFMVLFI